MTLTKCQVAQADIATVVTNWFSSTYQNVTGSRQVNSIKGSRQLHYRVFHFAFRHALHVTSRLDFSFV
jgi:hypothetical protein